MLVTGVVRTLMALNSCINPIVYATTIPEFKRLLKSSLMCKPLNDSGDSGIKSMTETEEATALSPMSSLRRSWRRARTFSR